MTNNKYPLGDSPVCTRRESRDSHFDTYFRWIKVDAQPQVIEYEQDKDITALVFNYPSLTYGKQYFYQILVLEEKPNKNHSEGFQIASNTIPTKAEIRKLIATKRFHQNTTPME